MRPACRRSRAQAGRTEPRWWFEPESGLPSDAEPSFVVWLRAEGLAGIPRQFGVVRVLGMLVVFALAFGLMRWLGAPTSVFVGVTLFFVLVGTGQAVLFRGMQPRAASVFTGLVAGPVVAVVMVLLEVNFGVGAMGSALEVTALALFFGVRHRTRLCAISNCSCQHSPMGQIAPSH